LLSIKSKSASPLLLLSASKRVEKKRFSPIMISSDS